MAPETNGRMLAQASSRWHGEDAPNGGSDGEQGTLSWGPPGNQIWIRNGDKNGTQKQQQKMIKKIYKKLMPWMIRTRVTSLSDDAGDTRFEEELQGRLTSLSNDAGDEWLEQERLKHELQVCHVVLARSTL